MAPTRPTRGGGGATIQKTLHLKKLAVGFQAALAYCPCSRVAAAESSSVFNDHGSLHRNPIDGHFGRTKVAHHGESNPARIRGRNGVRAI